MLFFLLIISIDVMLAQLPRHTVAKKVENYEHLDLLWGKDVDKVVFPHVLDLLNTYAPVENSTAQKALSSNHVNSTNPPGDSTRQTTGLRKREISKLNTNVPRGDFSHYHGLRVGGLSYAKHGSEGNESDSDDTVREDPSAVKSFTGASKMDILEDKIASQKESESSPDLGDCSQ
jgi:hypothetical protein